MLELRFDAQSYRYFAKLLISSLDRPMNILLFFTIASLKEQPNVTAVPRAFPRLAAPQTPA